MAQINGNRVGRVIHMTLYPMFMRQLICSPETECALHMREHCVGIFTYENKQTEMGLKQIYCLIWLTSFMVENSTSGNQNNSK